MGSRRQIASDTHWWQRDRSVPWPIDPSMSCSWCTARGFVFLLVALRQPRPVVTATSSKRHPNDIQTAPESPHRHPDGAPHPAQSKGRGGWGFEVSGGRQPGANTTQNNDTPGRGSNASQTKKDRRATVQGGAPGGVTPHPDVSSITMSLSTRRKGAATTRYRRRNNLPGLNRQQMARLRCCRQPVRAPDNSIRNPPPVGTGTRAASRSVCR
jgi:hypothetical protein